jgi:hypothetical protein
MRTTVCPALDFDSVSGDRHKCFALPASSVVISITGCAEGEETRAPSRDLFGRSGRHFSITHLCHALCCAVRVKSGTATDLLIAAFVNAQYTRELVLDSMSFAKN